MQKTSPHNDVQSRVCTNALDPQVSFLSLLPDA
jgi:hypothetical protein